MMDVIREREVRGQKAEVKATSPSTERFDRFQKMPRYALAGVFHIWVVDLSKRRVEVHAREGIDWRLVECHSGSVTFSAAPFEAVAIELGALWS